MFGLGTDDLGLNPIGVHGGTVGLLHCEHDGLAGSAFIAELNGLDALLEGMEFAVGGVEEADTVVHAGLDRAGSRADVEFEGLDLRHSPFGEFPEFLVLIGQCDELRLDLAGFLRFRKIDFGVLFSVDPSLELDQFTK